MALALWRGNALADLAYEEFARTEIERLEELRLVATEERIDAELALGRHDTLIAELESLVAKHPLRERLRGQLMLALYRSGRQAEALRVYADTRMRLVDELGIEPSQPLRDLEQAILRQDPALDLPRPAARKRRRRVAAGALALALAGVVAAAVVAFTQGGTESAQALAEADSNVFLSADTGKVVSQADAVRETVFVRYGAGSLWSVSSEGELTRIDPETGEIIDTIGLGSRAGRARVRGGLRLGHGQAARRRCIRIDPAVNADRRAASRCPTAGLGTRSTGRGRGRGGLGLGRARRIQPGRVRRAARPGDRARAEALLDPRRRRRPPRLR